MLSAIFLDKNPNGARPLAAHKRTAYDDSSLRPLLGMTDLAMTRVDPLEMNLRVACGVPRLAELDIPRFQSMADEWAAEAKVFMARVEPEFHKEPSYWENDIDFFRLGCLCEYVACNLGISYIEEQKDLKQIAYTNPSDLFLNGVMDTRRGTCGNMAALHVAIAWRLGWPLSLACAASHHFCKYDDGKKRYNIETTNNGQHGWQSHPDEYYRKQYRIPTLAVRCGSDLRAVTPREMLGLFVGLRARHFRDVGEVEPSEHDYLLARYLFPDNRYNCNDQICVSALLNLDRFEPAEPGHPSMLWILDKESIVRKQINAQRRLRASVLGFL